MGTSSGKLVRVRCRDCRRFHRVGANRVVWCPDCGGELKRIPNTARRAKPSDR